MSASLAPQWIFQALTADGKVASGAKLYTFISGTSTLSPLYADEGMGTPLSNPLELDSGGYGDFWLDDSKIYRFRLVDSDGELIKERSGVSASSLKASDFSDDSTPPYGAGLIGYKGRTVSERLSDVASALDYNTLDEAIAANPSSILIPTEAIQIASESPSNPAGVPFVGEGTILVAVDSADLDKGYHRYPFVEDAGRITFGEEYLQALHKKFRDAQGGPRPYIYLDGDSTIEGYAALYGTPGDNALDDDHKPHNILVKALRRRGIYVGIVNRAVSGSGIAAFHLSNADIDDADGIVISFGINDTIGAGKTYATVGDWIAVYRSKLAAIRARRNVHQCAIIIKTSSHVSVTLEGRDETQAWAQRKALRQAARDYQCAFFDTPAYWSDVRRNHNTGVGITGVWNDATPFPTLLQDGLMDDPYRTVPALLDSDKYGSAIHPLALMNVWIWERIADFIAVPGVRRYATNSVFIDGSSKSVAASDKPWAYDLGITYSRAPASAGFPIDGAVTTLRTPDKVTHQMLMGYVRNTFGGVQGQDGLTATRHSLTDATATITFSADFITGNTIAGAVDGDAYSVPFATSHAQTLTNLISALEALPNTTAESAGARAVKIHRVQSADLVVTSAVTGGASQPIATIVTALEEIFSAWYMPYNRIPLNVPGGPDAWFTPHNGEFDHIATAPGEGGAPAAGWFHYRHWCFSSNADYARQDATGFAGGVGSWYRDRVAGAWGAWVRDWSAEAKQTGMGASLSSRTAGGSYDATAQTMLQEAHNKIRIMESKLKAIGIIAD